MPESKRRILHKIKIDEVSGVDNPCQEHARVMIMKRADTDGSTAMADGSFPITNTSDLSKAIKAIGGATNPASVRRHIVRRARALGATDQLPVSWNVAKTADSVPDRLAELKSKLVGLSKQAGNVDGELHVDGFLNGPKNKKKKMFDALEKLKSDIEAFSKSVAR